MAIDLLRVQAGAQAMRICRRRLGGPEPAAAADPREKGGETTRGGHVNAQQPHATTHAAILYTYILIWDVSVRFREQIHSRPKYTPDQNIITHQQKQIHSSAKRTNCNRTEG